MPKLKGLLDSANAKLAGLLGDFPQGFNAGAVAGFPGWAGDMAYLADTARLALTGADSQAAPEDYVGTTDYIAKQAGYPVPQTLSGQLGAAVGGLMSPGPGDLAKFAPVLSAIPFWHGSPHKFDAFDLAHMGKGEGAQAYGWGAYGAESPEVAKQYLNVDPSVPVPPRRQFMGQDLEPGTPEYHAARLASEGKESLAGLRKLVAGWISDARPGEPTDGYQKTLEILNQAQKTSDFKQLKPEPNLYRGEYRWPDPAKEAATPLTGEDLLDWDKPLSEQSDSVKAALRRMPSAPDESVWPQWTGQQFYESEVRAGTDFDGIPKGDARRAHSKSLFDAGIPGIRYLDGMSRTDGSGTHNLVMFSDEGIKLLERNGKPIEDFAARRAGKAKPYKEAMGIDTMSPMSAESFKVKPPKRLYRGVGDGGSTTGTYALGKGLYTSPDKSFAKMYGDVSEISPDEAWPRNPLVLNQVAGGAPGAFADWALKASGMKNMREFNAKYADPGEFVRSLGYDGVIAGDEVVKYSPDR